MTPQRRIQYREILHYPFPNKIDPFVDHPAVGVLQRFLDSSDGMPVLELKLESGKFNGTDMKMVKRGSSYLRWALLEAARHVAMRDNTFRTYYLKKEAEGKHHNVAMSHVAKKLVRVLHHLITNDISFIPQI